MNKTVMIAAAGLALASLHGPMAAAQTTPPAPTPAPGHTVTSGPPPSITNNSQIQQPGTGAHVRVGPPPTITNNSRPQVSGSGGHVTTTAPRVDVGPTEHNRTGEPTGGSTPSGASNK